MQPEARRRRLRPNRACTVCRDRKTRCDGRRPVCRACEQRCVSAECRFPSKEGVFYGQQPFSRHAGDESHPPGRPPESVDEAESVGEATVSHDDEFAANTSPSIAVTRGERTDDAVDGRPWSSTHSDGLGIFVGRHDNSVYGPSSTVAFLQSVLSEEGESSDCSPAVAASSKHKLQSVSSLERLPGRSNDGWPVLPRRRSADNFVSCFWDFIHPVFPVIHKPTFQRQYESFWMRETQSSQENGLALLDEDDVGGAIFQSVMNLVFALGCKFSSLVPDREKSAVANGFYQVSRQFFAFDVLDSASLTIVQLLILNGVYLQSTPHANRCWNSIGLAIRVAQGLGLHLEQRVAKVASQIEREMMRRIWYTCGCLDTLLAMTFGRPAIISKTKTLALPAMIDDEFLLEEGSGNQPAQLPSRMGLFVSSCRLIEVLSDVLDFVSRHESLFISVSSSETAYDKSELVKDVLDLDKRLEKVLESIPSHVRHAAKQTDNLQPTPSHFRLQREVFRCRFLQCRLLLLRPLLLSTVVRRSSTFETLPADNHRPTLDRMFTTWGCEACVQTAVDLVDTVYESLGTLYRSSGWHAVYFTFSAAIVLLTSMKCEPLASTFQDSNMETWWTRIFSILHHLEDQVHSASHAIKVIDGIRTRLDCPSTSAQDLALTASFTPTAVSNRQGLLSQSNADWSTDLSNWDMPASMNLAETFFGGDVNYGDWLDIFT